MIEIGSDLFHIYSALPFYRCIFLLPLSYSSLSGRIISVQIAFLDGVNAI